MIRLLNIDKEALNFQNSHQSRINTGYYSSWSRSNGLSNLQIYRFQNTCQSIANFYQRSHQNRSCKLSCRTYSRSSHRSTCHQSNIENTALLVIAVHRNPPSRINIGCCYMFSRSSHFRGRTVGILLHTLDSLRHRNCRLGCCSLHHKLGFLNKMEGSHLDTLSLSLPVSVVLFRKPSL